MNYDDYKEVQADVGDWVINKCDSWRDHYESNYRDKFDEYYRIWRGIWSVEDKMRQSERSKLVSPATQQAIESAAAEVEEATFGRGRFFDLKDDMQDEDNSDIAFLRSQLDEDFANTKIRKHISDVIQIAAVYGTGIGELVLDEVKEMKPATRPAMEGAMTAFGVEVYDRTVVKLNPVLPNNFLIDPTATCIEDALGVAVDEFVPMHQVEQLQESGVYMEADLESHHYDSELETDQDLMMHSDDRVRLTKYYGLVPRSLLEEAGEDIDEVEVVTLTDDEEDAEMYVEAVVVVANGGVLLKAEATPYMMEDRPIVAFQWDSLPSRFWGRGITEKGYNAQKALDAEMRARIDALALTVHPMMAVDASRLPRGHKMEVRPGKTILTNGNPNEVLQPLNFGQVSSVTFQQGQVLQQMVQQATGALDGASTAALNGEGTAAGLSMGMSAAVKRYKRTLTNFQESFLVPFVRKAAWRYMQFNPEVYPVGDYKFTPYCSLGMIAREYEVTQLVQLLQTVDKQSPMYALLLEGVIDHMNVSNREQLIEALRAANEPDPAAAEAQQMQLQAQQQMVQAQTAAFAAQANEANSRAEKYQAEIEIARYKAETERLKMIAETSGEEDPTDKEFERRYKMAELLLKEKEIEKTQTQQVQVSQTAQASDQETEALMARLEAMNGMGNEEI